MVLVSALLAYYCFTFLIIFHDIRRSDYFRRYLPSVTMVVLFNTITVTAAALSGFDTRLPPNIKIDLNTSVTAIILLMLFNVGLALIVHAVKVNPRIHSPRYLPSWMSVFPGPKVTRLFFNYSLFLLATFTTINVAGYMGVLAVSPVRPEIYGAISGLLLFLATFNIALRCWIWPLSILIVLGYISYVLQGVLYAYILISLVIVYSVAVSLRRPPILLILAIVAGYFILTPVREYIRLDVSTFQSDVPLTSNSTQELHSLSEQIMSEQIMSEFRLENLIRRVLLRAGHTFETFSLVLDLTPSKIDHWHGHTYQGLPYLLVPRVFAPSKPTETYGNKFGQRYGVLSDSDFETSYNLPILSEAYSNFGYLGFFAMTFLLGMLFGAFNAIYSWLGYNRLYLILLFSILAPFYLPESNFTLLLGTALLNMVKLISLFLPVFITSTWIKSD